MTTPIGRLIVEDFVKNAHSTLTHLRLGLAHFLDSPREQAINNISMSKIQKQHLTSLNYSSKTFFLRSSIEYSNPQLTVEEVQGIIGLRLLEAFGNYFVANMKNFR